MADHLKMLLEKIKDEEEEIRKANQASYKKLYIGVAIYYLIGTAFYIQSVRIANAEGASDMSAYGPPDSG